MAQVAHARYITSCGARYPGPGTGFSRVGFVWRVEKGAPDASLWLIDGALMFMCPYTPTVPLCAHILIFSYKATSLAELGLNLMVSL